MDSDRIRGGLFEEEQVDFDFLISLVEEDLRATTATDDLIDRFLEIKDLRIVVDEEGGEEIEEEEIDLQGEPLEDDFPSEELAKIYLSQGLYREANEIYSKLFLLYSEKITYFATQIANLSEKQPKEGAEREAEEGREKK